MRQAALSGISSPSHPLGLAATPLTNRSGAAEVATKTVNSWSNALDKPGLFEINAPNDDQCGLFDVGAPSHDQRGPFDAQNDNQCALKESAVASPEAFKLADPVRRHLRLAFALNPHLDTPSEPYLIAHLSIQADAMPDDAAKGFGRSASLDAAAAAGAKPCVTAAPNTAANSHLHSKLACAKTNLRCSRHTLQAR